MPRARACRAVSPRSVRAHPQPYRPRPQDTRRNAGSGSARRPECVQVPGTTTGREVGEERSRSPVLKPTPEAVVRGRAAAFAQALHLKSGAQQARAWVDEAKIQLADRVERAQDVHLCLPLRVERHRVALPACGRERRHRNDECRHRNDRTHGTPATLQGPDPEHDPFIGTKGLAL